MNGMTGMWTTRPWPTEPPVLGGAYHALIGTLLITMLGHHHLGPDRPADGDLPGGIQQGRRALARAITFFVDVMTGIPSIVAGLFAAALFGADRRAGHQDRRRRPPSRCPC